MLVSQFFGLSRHLVYSIIKERSESLKMNTHWSNIKISSYFSIWKLDYFSDMAFLKNIFDTRKILDETLSMFLFLPANHIEFFSVMSKSDMEPRHILLNISPIPTREIPNKVFLECVFYVIEKVFVLKARLQWSGLRLNHRNIASIKTKNATKIL